MHRFVNAKSGVLVAVVVLVAALALWRVAPAQEQSAPTRGGSDEAAADPAPAAAEDPFEASGANVMLEILDEFERFWLGVTPPGKRRLDGLVRAIEAESASGSQDPVAVVIGRGTAVVLRIVDAMTARAAAEDAVAPGAVEADEQPDRVLADPADLGAALQQLAPLLESLAGGTLPAGDLSALPSPEALRELVERVFPGAAAAVDVDGSTDDRVPAPTDAELARALRGVQRSVKRLERRIGRLERLLAAREEDLSPEGESKERDR